MERKNYIARTVLLAALSVSFGPDKTISGDEASPVIPRVAHAIPDDPPVLLKDFDLPSLVEESDVVIDRQSVLSLNTTGKQPDRIIGELVNKESGAVLSNTQIEVYYEESKSQEVWGLAIPIMTATTGISVDVILPTILEKSETRSTIVKSEENLILLNEKEVVSLTNEAGEIDVVILKDRDRLPVEDFNKFPNGGAFEGGTEEVAIRVNLEISGTLYSATESLPRSN